MSCSRFCQPAQEPEVNADTAVNFPELSIKTRSPECLGHLKPLRNSSDSLTHQPPPRKSKPSSPLTEESFIKPQRTHKQPPHADSFRSHNISNSTRIIQRKSPFKLKNRKQGSCGSPLRNLVDRPRSLSKMFNIAKREEFPMLPSHEGRRPDSLLLQHPSTPLNPSDDYNRPPVLRISQPSTATHQPGHQNPSVTHFRSCKGNNNLALVGLPPSFEEHVENIFDYLAPKEGDTLRITSKKNQNQSDYVIYKLFLVCKAYDCEATKEEFKKTHILTDVEVVRQGKPSCAEVLSKKSGTRPRYNSGMLIYKEVAPKVMCSKGVFKRPPFNAILTGKPRVGSDDNKNGAVAAPKLKTDQKPNAWHCRSTYPLNNSVSIEKQQIPSQTNTAVAVNPQMADQRSPRSSSPINTVKPGMQVTSPAEIIEGVRQLSIGKTSSPPTSYKNAVERWLPKETNNSGPKKPNETTPVVWPTLRQGSSEIFIKNLCSRLANNLTSLNWGFTPTIDLSTIPDYYLKAFPSYLDDPPVKLNSAGQIWEPDHEITPVVYLPLDYSYIASLGVKCVKLARFCIGLPWNDSYVPNPFLLFEQ